MRPFGAEISNPDNSANPCILKKPTTRQAVNPEARCAKPWISRVAASLPSANPNSLPNITAPSLIIWGRYDRMCVFEIGIAALNNLEDSRLVALNNCGHWAPFEKPEEYTAHVLNFLQGW